jgi:rod shape-determining protein MreD
MATRTLPGYVETAVLLALGIATVIVSLVPLGPGGAMAPPDLLYCLLVAWVVRRPGRMPIWAVLGLGLFGDVMLSRPIGLGALALLLVTEVFRARALLLNSIGFLAEWLAATVGFAAMLAGMSLALRLVFAAPPGMAASLHYLLATALAYPLVVLGLTWCLRLRAPRVADGDYRLRGPV